MIDVFFFKQKTAYEMRISDWSSDVCSSDLLEMPAFAGMTIMALTLVIDTATAACSVALIDDGRAVADRHEIVGRGHAERLLPMIAELPGGGRADDIHPLNRLRSEEHTSELQSLMRISYAVFCLKKKKRIQRQCCNPNNISNIYY